MALQKEFLKNLKSYFKLNIYEVKIWLALLSKGVSSASELSELSGVPRSRCYDILDSLEKKGFIIMKIGKPIEYMAMKPEIILDRVNQNIKEEADKTISSIEKVIETDDFRELDLLYKTGIKHVDITKISKSVVGASIINKQIKDMISSAKSNVVIATNVDGLYRKMRVIKNIIPTLRKRGVEVRLYAPYDRSLLKKLDGVKFMDCSTNAHFVSVDNKEIMFMVTPDSVVPEYEVGIWLKSDFFVNAVNILFEQGVRR